MCCVMAHGCKTMTEHLYLEALNLDSKYVDDI